MSDTRTLVEQCRERLVVMDCGCGDGPRCDYNASLIAKCDAWLTERDETVADVMAALKRTQALVRTPPPPSPSHSEAYVPRSLWSRLVDWCVPSSSLTAWSNR